MLFEVSRTHWSDVGILAIDIIYQQEPVLVETGLRWYAITEQHNTKNGGLENSRNQGLLITLLLVVLLLTRFRAILVVSHRIGARPVIEAGSNRSDRPARLD